ncbi:MAG: hypothetical protein HZC36_05650 [Armatimonadetes bacterium]|nr:hypothetical protein [Armatimonadota bacterium]
MTTRWLDLRYPLAGAIGLLLLYVSWQVRLALLAALSLLLLLLLIGAVRYVADSRARATNGGGFPSQADQERENDHDFDILMLEQDILTRLNQARQVRGVDPVGLHSELLFRARRHSLRMIKVPFFGTKDIEEGDLCERTGTERGAQAVAALVLRFGDHKLNPSEYCVRTWLRSRRTRNIVFADSFAIGAVGIVRNAHTRTIYVTCLLVSPSSI